MPKRALAALIVVIMLAVPATALAASWRTYVNERFGTTADVPADWRAGEPPDNGDGLEFTSPDRQASIAVWGSLNGLGTTKEMAIFEAAGEGEIITYRYRNNRSIVVSGIRRDRIFYRKSVLSCRDQVWNSVAVEYPSAEKRAYDAIVNHVARSLRPGKGVWVVGC